MSSIEEPEIIFEEPAANNVTTANTGVTQSLSDSSITVMSSSEEAPPPSIEEIPSPSPSAITSSIEVPREVSQSLTSISRKRKADGRLGKEHTNIIYHPHI